MFYHDLVYLYSQYQQLKFHSSMPSIYFVKFNTRNQCLITALAFRLLGRFITCTVTLEKLTLVSFQNPIVIVCCVHRKPRRRSVFVKFESVRFYPRERCRDIEQVSSDTRVPAIRVLGSSLRPRPASTNMPHL